MGDRPDRGGGGKLVAGLAQKCDKPLDFQHRVNNRDPENDVDLQCGMHRSTDSICLTIRWLTDFGEKKFRHKCDAVAGRVPQHRPIRSYRQVPR